MLVSGRVQGFKNNQKVGFLAGFLNQQYIEILNFRWHPTTDKKDARVEFLDELYQEAI